MSLSTLDPTTFLRTNIIDTFDSMIWTERYNQYGDVTIVLPENTNEAALLSEGTFVYLDGSDEVMIIETVSTKTGITTVTGKSLVGFLVNRIARNTWATTSGSWSLTGAAGAIAAAIVTQMCISGYMSANAVVPTGYGAAEVIPNLSIGTSATGTSLSVAVQYGDVYTAVKTVCDLDDIGFFMRLVDISAGTGAIVFSTYRGADRTTDQSTNDPVIFEPALDSFTDIQKLNSISGYKNVAYAWANAMTAQTSIGVAVAPGTTPTGFNRRTMMVNASDVNSADYTAANLILVLNQKAKDALANNNYVRMTDGQIVPQSEFAYGVDYFLGDIIELRADDNTIQQARITEYIRAQDTTGATEYPTLSVI